MGFGARATAFATLERIKDLPPRDGADKSQERGSNATPFPGFYELDRDDQKDGGLAGDVFQLSPSGQAHSMGRFQISGSGKVQHFPGLSPAERQAIETGDFAPVTPKKPTTRRGPKARRGLLG